MLFVIPNPVGVRNLINKFLLSLQKISYEKITPYYCHCIISNIMFK